MQPASPAVLISNDKAYHSYQLVGRMFDIWVGMVLIIFTVSALDI